MTKRHEVHVGIWVGIGMAVGGILGVVAGNIPRGVKIGAAVGLVLGYFLRWHFEHRAVTVEAVPVPAGRPVARNSMRILVIGATGGTGRQLLDQALERGYEVTAFVRNPSKLPSRHERLRIIQGDVMDYAAVESSVRGQDAVLSALGHKRFLFPTTILSAGTGNVIRAMEGLGVKRFVCETSLGIADSRGRLGLYYTLFLVPILLRFYYRDKELQERHIKDSSLEWIIVRPGVLTNGPRRGTYCHGQVGHWLWTVRISRADVATFMLDQLENTPYLRQSPGVCW
jgi:putative NADH-flavin reductase